MSADTIFFPSMWPAVWIACLMVGVMMGCEGNVPAFLSRPKLRGSMTAVNARAQRQINTSPYAVEMEMRYRALVEERHASRMTAGQVGHGSDVPPAQLRGTLSERGLQTSHHDEGVARASHAEDRLDTSAVRRSDVAVRTRDQGAGDVHDGGFASDSEPHVREDLINGGFGASEFASGYLSWTSLIEDYDSTSLEFSYDLAIDSLGL